MEKEGLKYPTAWLEKVPDGRGSSGTLHGLASNIPRVMMARRRRGPSFPASGVPAVLFLARASEQQDQEIHGKKTWRASSIDC